MVPFRNDGLVAAQHDICPPLHTHIDSKLVENLQKVGAAAISSVPQQIHFCIRSHAIGVRCLSWATLNHKVLVKRCISI
jgi:hypothetical protein